MQLPAFLLSLKFRLVAVVVTTGLLTAVGTSTLLLRATESDLRSQLLRMDSEDAERTAGLLSGKLEMLKGALVAVTAQARAPVWADREAMQRFLLDKPALNSLFDTVLAVAPDGGVLVRIERGKATPERPNVAERDYFQQAMRTDQPVVSAPLIGKVSQQAMVIMGASAQGDDGARLGVVAGVVRLQSNGLLSDGPLHSRVDGTLNLVVDRQGILVSHPDPARLLAPASQIAGLRQVLRRWLDDGSPIDIDGRAELSDGHLVAIAGIPLSDWLHVRVTPEALALQPLQAAREAAWRAAAASGLLAALLAGGVAWWFVRPIAQLRQRAVRLSTNSDNETLSWSHGRDELGDMGRAFEQLLAERNRQQAEQRALLLQVESVLDHVDVGIALSIKGRFARVSRRLCQVLHCERTDLLGQPTRLMHASDAAHDALTARVRQALGEHGVFDSEVELVRRDGEAFWARLRGRTVVQGERSAGTIWVIEDVTEARAQRERLTWSASHDSLTGLLNRAAFEARLEAAVCAEHEQPYCALFIDLDRFKHVNDTAGHAAGDALLRGVAGVLAGCLRRNDVVARLGGDEFAVLLPQCPIPQGRLIGEKLRAAVETHALEWQGSTYGVGASVGLVIGNGTHTSAAEVLREADAACYAAKRAGRNRVACMAQAAG